MISSFVFGGARTLMKGPMLLSMVLLAGIVLAACGGDS